MTRTALLGRVVVAGFPLAFVVYSWLAAAGFPYYLDNNETFLSYVHARNLEIWNPWEYGWLTAHGTDPTSPTTEFVYSHNPNGPRYLHYLLLRLGARDLSAHVLVLSLLGAGLTSWLLLRLFGRPLLLVVPLAVVLDFAGFLAWTVNTYRVWTFVLYFGMALAVARRRPGWLGVLAFCAFQVEYGLALFLSATMAALALLLDGRQAWRPILALVLGGGCSVGLFFGQVLAYYGWHGLLDELAATYGRRGALGDDVVAGPGKYLFQAWYGNLLMLRSIALETYNRVVVVIIIAGACIAALRLARGRYTGEQRMLAALLMSTLAGMAATSALLYGYYVDGYVFSLLPLAVFLVATATGIVAVEIHDVIERLTWLPRGAVACSLAAVVPVVAASLTAFHAPVAVSFMRTLQLEYQGRPIVAPNIVSWQMNSALAFALTNGRAAHTSDYDATPGDVERLASLREADGTLTYACIDTLYIRKAAAQGGTSVCEVATERMVGRGDTLLASGFGWSILRVHAPEPSVAADATDAP